MSVAPQLAAGGEPRAQQDGQPCGGERSPRQISLLSFRHSKGKWSVSRILKIENVNENNLNVFYNCTVFSEKGIDTKSFTLLKKGLTKFYFWVWGNFECGC